MASRSFRRFVEEELGKFPHFLIYALLEWVLIFVLFIDGFLAFFTNEFAKFFELQIPCLLCTRIDHVLIHRNQDFYYNESICESHKKNVSCLAYCHVHKKLSDIRKMCEGCLLSFATEKESDCDTYKSLVGILHKDLELFVEDDQQINLALPSGKKEDEVQVIEKKSSAHFCSCCGDPLKVKSVYSKGIVHNSAKNSSLYSQAPAPSPRSPFAASGNEESRNLELPHIRYTELKFMSGNELEVPEDEDGSNAMNHNHQFKEDVKAAAVPLLTESEDLNEDRTPIYGRGNKFFGIPLTDSASSSPRWITRFNRKSPLEKTEFSSECADGNASNEGDGDSILHHLKRQVRLDRKSLMALYMELDEERSASAVAANNAMAMITRLQAEKAAVQMDALQYQRMMEEQAEYDQEALQATKDLLSKREAELKVLEAELESFREKYGILREEGFEMLQDEADESYQESKSPTHSSLGERSDCGSSSCNSINGGENNGDFMHNYVEAGSSKEKNGGKTLYESLKDIEGERTYLLDRLKNLQKKIDLSANDDDDHSSQSSSDISNQVKDETGNATKVILTRELSHLSERVQALEEDSGFLKNAARSLQEGSEGTQLLTEISHNLQKLRHFVTNPMEDSDGLFSSFAY